ncbi:methylamine utilization protein [Neptunicella sp. SCSIO 80796]|uniref:methylamine utilization protein n=1 Tax=Neptunicella plasticusilytica TaxID=3117012 RepID=UPI003A4D9642
MRQTVFIILLVATLYFACKAHATRIEVLVNSSNEVPLSNIAVYLEPVDKTDMPVKAAPKDHSAIMDQIDKQFKPHILVVQKSAWVNFPNSDSIKHHVYSFSDAKSFELKLYSGGSASSIQFEQTGEVALGCNIHDWMLGYIYVVDTPWFGKTDKQGKVTLNVPAGEYQLKFWSPLLKQADKGFSKLVQIQQDTTTTLILKDELQPALIDYEDTDELTGY